MARKTSKGEEPERRKFGALRKLPSGNWQASYIGPDGVRYKAPATFDTRADAAGWLEVREREINWGDWQAGLAKRGSVQRRDTEPFGSYAAEWVRTRTSPRGEPLKPRTRQEYERLLATTLKPLSAMRLVGISPDIVTAWYAEQVQHGTVTQASRAYSLMKSIFKTAVKRGRVKENPCDVQGAHHAVTGKKVAPPSPAELEAITRAMPERYRAAVALAAWAGVRFGELTELRRKDIREIAEADVQMLLVNVERAVTHTTGVGYQVGAPKSAAGVRLVPLPPHVAPVVRNHLREYVGDSPESLLFPAADGLTHLAQSTLVKHFYPARKAAGRSDMPWHALRHYGATRAALAGATLKELQTRLGHSTVAAAMRYQHDAGRELDLARRMSELDV